MLKFDKSMKWCNTPSGVPGYTLTTYGQWADTIKRLANNGEFQLLAFYMEKLNSKPQFMAGLEQAQREISLYFK